MKRIILSLIALTCLLLPTTAYAYDPLSNACGAGGGTASGSTACGANGSDPITGKNGILEKAATIIAGVAGVAAVIIIIVAGITFATSGGNAQRIESARSAIIGAVVGLIIIALASTIVAFVAGRV
jgi:type IV secretory pathway VirB2 component (pilin)